MKAFTYRRYGKPEVLELEDLAGPKSRTTECSCASVPRR